MADQVLSPTKESANTVLLLRDVLTLMGSKMLADKSTKSLIKAAERVEAAFESKLAMSKAHQLLAEAEVAVESARLEAAAVTVDAKRKIDEGWRTLGDAEAALRERNAAAIQQSADMDTRTQELAARENSVAGREASSQDTAQKLSDDQSRLNAAVKVAKKAKQDANAVRVEYETKMQRVHDAVGG